MYKKKNYTILYKIFTISSQISNLKDDNIDCT